MIVLPNNVRAQAPDLIKLCPALSTFRANTIGSAYELTTMPIVTNIAKSRHLPLCSDTPDDRLAIRVGNGAKM